MTYMNALAGFVRANNPSVMPLFWGDMIHPLHNGGTQDYQRAFGGKAGATEGAGKLLAKGIGLIPWWYTTPSTDPRAEPVMKASRGFFNNYSRCTGWAARAAVSRTTRRGWRRSSMAGAGSVYSTRSGVRHHAVLDGLGPAAEATWNTKGDVNCTSMYVVFLLSVC